jgi:hypothetical protein
MQSDQTAIKSQQFSPEMHYMFQDVEDQTQKDSYFEAHNARKKVQEDAKILRNRIALLKSEESKVRKKIDDTKVKAKEVSQIQERNNEAIKKRDEVLIDKLAHEGKSRGD